MFTYCFSRFYERAKLYSALLNLWFFTTWTTQFLSSDWEEKERRKIDSIGSPEMPQTRTGNHKMFEFRGRVWVMLFIPLSWGEFIPVKEFELRRGSRVIRVHTLENFSSILDGFFLFCFVLNSLTNNRSISCIWMFVQQICNFSIFMLY